MLRTSDNNNTLYTRCVHKHAEQNDSMVNALYCDKTIYGYRLESRLVLGIGYELGYGLEYRLVIGTEYGLGYGLGYWLGFVAI